MEVECCDEDLFDTFKKDAKGFKIEIKPFDLEDIEFLDIFTNGDYSVIFEKGLDVTNKSFKSYLCSQCINRILWSKLNSLTTKVKGLEEYVEAQKLR